MCVCVCECVCACACVCECVCVCVCVYHLFQKRDLGIAQGDGFVLKQEGNESVC